MSSQGFTRGGTLDHQPNTEFKSDTLDPAVRTALKVVQDNYQDKVRQDNKNYWIQRLYESGFVTWDPTGPKKFSSKTMYQLHWKAMSRMKPLDYAIHGENSTMEKERLVTDGVSTVMNRGGYNTSLRQKNGVFSNLLAYGDAWQLVGTNPDSPELNPMMFQTISNSNVYIDRYSTVMDGSWGREVRKICLLFSFSWQEAITHFPKLKRSGTKGRIPRELGLYKDSERDWYQSTRLEDITEVAYYFDLDNLTYCVFGGRGCTLLEKKVGKDKYPYFMNDEPYIPVLHWKGMPSLQGFYNHGIGDMVYDLALITEKLFNMELGHIEENVFPITLVNTPQGQASEFMQKLKMAYKMRTAGNKAFVAMEYDPSGPNTPSQAQSLLTNNLFQEWQAVNQKLENEINRNGVGLDEIDRGPNPTATQILAEEDARNAFIKQLMEYNVTTTEKAVNITMDGIKKFVKTGNKMKLDLTTRIPVEGPNKEVVEKRADGVTLGAISDELRKKHYFAKVNARSGAIPSNVYTQTQIGRMMPFAQPGSPAYIKLINQLGHLNDTDIPAEEYMVQQAQQVAPEGAEGEIQPEAAQTERLEINPRTDDPLPAI